MTPAWPALIQGQEEPSTHTSLFKPPEGSCPVSKLPFELLMGIFRILYEDLLYDYHQRTRRPHPTLGPIPPLPWKLSRDTSKPTGPSCYVVKPHPIRYFAAAISLVNRQWCCLAQNMLYKSVICRSLVGLEGATDALESKPELASQVRLLLIAPWWTAFQTTLPPVTGLDGELLSTKSRRRAVVKVARERQEARYLAYLEGLVRIMRLWKSASDSSSPHGISVSGPKSVTLLSLSSEIVFHPAVASSILSLSNLNKLYIKSGPHPSLPHFDLEVALSTFGSHREAGQLDLTLEDASSALAPDHAGLVYPKSPMKRLGSFRLPVHPLRLNSDVWLKSLCLASIRVTPQDFLRISSRFKNLKYLTIRNCGILAPWHSDYAREDDLPSRELAASAFEEVVNGFKLLGPGLTELDLVDNTSASVQPDRLRTFRFWKRGEREEQFFGDGRAIHHEERNLWNPLYGERCLPLETAHKIFLRCLESCTNLQKLRLFPGLDLERLFTMLIEKPGVPAALPTLQKLVWLQRATVEDFAKWQSFLMTCTPKSRESKTSDWEWNNGPKKARRLACLSELFLAFDRRGLPWSMKEEDVERDLVVPLLRISQDRGLKIHIVKNEWEIQKIIKGMENSTQVSLVCCIDPWHRELLRIVQYAD